MSEQSFIPFHIPSIGEEEISEAAAALRSGWLTTGPRTAQFEREFKEYVHVSHALAVNSGTAALHLALAGLGIGPGDEVITTPLTFCATVNTILQVGAVPVLADIGADGNIDPASVAQRITGRTRAILPVHLGGLPCEMDQLWSLARQHGLFVIEDAAHAVGSLYRGQPIGGGSDAVAFSFYATKNLTTGEGGMVTTNNSALAESMRILCLHGITKDAWNRYAQHGNWYYEVQACGFKYNLSDIQSAIGIHQLRKQEHFIEVRTRYARLYSEALAGVPEVDIPPDPEWRRHSWHLYILRLNLELLDINRDEFIRELHRKGIGASVHFIPVPLHPFFKEYASRPENFCPRALALYPRLVSLPLYPAMSENQVSYVSRTVKEIVTAAKRRKPVFLAATTP
ncbi:MAG TPA: DegT/DnrJ/EryC1/StrS family aminotransferase [Bryobacterales bacterium]|nr:DegT/DnrJ/EryC1/StrS family aminotransferase [Bryobacterales bacterium]